MGRKWGGQEKQAMGVTKLVVSVIEVVERVLNLEAERSGFESRLRHFLAM